MKRAIMCAVLGFSTIGMSVINTDETYEPKSIEWEYSEEYFEAPKENPPVIVINYISADDIYENSNSIIEESISEETPAVSDLELNTLARLIHAEAGNQDLMGKVLVGCVVMNRVKSPIFPNTVDGVIFQKGQFSVISNGSYYKVDVDDDSYEAARLCLDNHTAFNPNILFFDSCGGVNGKNHFKHGDHWFGE